MISNHAYRGEIFFLKETAAGFISPPLSIPLPVLAGERLGEGGKVIYETTSNQSQLVYLSPNQIEVDIDLKTPDTLVINQNFHPGWKVSLVSRGLSDSSSAKQSEENRERVDKVILLSYNGLLSAKLAKPGQYRVVFKYLPWDFLIGLIISIISFVLFGTIIIWKKRKILALGERLKNVEIRII